MITPQEFNQLPQNAKEEIDSLREMVKALRKRLLHVVPLLRQSHRLVPKDDDEDDDDDDTT